MAASLRTTLILCAFSLLAGSPAFSQAPSKTLPQRAAAGVSEGCDLGTASADLDVGGVRARLYNTGNLFWRGGDSIYEVPKGSGVRTVNAAGVWVGGLVNGEIRTSGADYSAWEWAPGPLDATGNAPTDCAAFDRIWLVTQQPDGTLTGDVADWPADLGAPFDDADGDGVYEPAAGETPTVYGHQTAFWVMNDRGPERMQDTVPLGLTARVTAHAFNSADPALGFGTFYRYTFENPNAHTIENARMGFYSDADVGNWTDDLTGSDPARGMGFIYNGDNDDPDYGKQPPALGVDFLSGTEGVIRMGFGTGGPTDDPVFAQDFYRFLNLTWRDGVPLTVGNFGYNPDDPDAEQTTWYAPGAPEQLAYWSELNVDEERRIDRPGERKFVTVAEPFELAPGATHTVDMAIVWGRGVAFLDSVTKLREHSDRVQAAYDAGTLFAPGGAQTGPPDGSAPPEPEPSLATPVLIAPDDGADLDDVELVELYDGCLDELPEHECLFVELRWEPVPGALYYGGFNRNTYALAQAYTPNVSEERTWGGFRAFTATEQSLPSETRTYRTRTYFLPDFQDEGRGIVEVTYDGTSTCDADPARPGCTDYGGATVWHTPSTNADYYVTADGGVGTLDRLGFRIEIAAPFDYEMRFTDACAADSCWGVYTILSGLRDTGLAVRVPFELWQIDPNDPGREVRLIPLLGAASESGPGATWPYGVGENDWDGFGFGTADPDAPVSDVIFWMMPDQPDGYALLAADAAAAGAGNPITDSDTQEDLDPTSGDACRNQGFYIDFCHRNDEIDGLSSSSRAFMPLIGRFQLADQARDGTPPPPGTTIRLLTTKPEPVAAETDGPLPRTLSLAAYPNPTRGTATLAYTLPEAGRTTVTVYDVLGRRVAVLADGEAQATGRHRAMLDTGRWATGVYVAVLETAAGRQTQTLTVLR